MPRNFAELVNVFVDLLNLVIPTLVLLILIVFIWKVIDAWIINAGDEQKVQEGKKTVVVGIVVLVCITALWGIVAILQRSLFGI